MSREKLKKIELENIEKILSRLDKRKVLFEPNPQRGQRRKGHDNPFTERDLVSVYNYDTKRIYYIVGRGRAERIIDSLLSKGNTLMKFYHKTYIRNEIRYFKVLEDRMGSRAKTAIIWTPTETFDNVHLVGALKMSVQKDGSYKIERAKSSAHPCIQCKLIQRVIDNELVECPQLEGNIISLEICSKISHSHYRKAWKWIVALLNKMVLDLEHSSRKRNDNRS